MAGGSGPPTVRDTTRKLSAVYMLAEHKKLKAAN
jgi:hypothetical protein